MQLRSKFNKRFRFLLCFIDTFSKYAWVVPLKDKKGVSISDGFQKVLDKSGRKPSKIWVDKGTEFYNSSFKKWLKDNDIEMYSIHNEGKSKTTSTDSSFGTSSLSLSLSASFFVLPNKLS